MEEEDFGLSAFGLSGPPEVTRETVKWAQPSVDSTVATIFQDTN